MLVNQLVGLACQFIQDTDSRFPLWYFTVDSAIAAAAVALLTLLVPRARCLPVLRHTAAVGVIVSAVIFAAFIAPGTETGTWFQPHDDTAVRMATVLFHGTAPILVVADYLLHQPRIRALQAVAWAYLWPLTYFAGLCVLVAVFGQSAVPYPFLSPEAMGWAAVACAVIALILLVSSCGLILGALSRTRRRRWAGRQTDDPPR
ncbi:hypothetical protein A5740_03060 [Mycobacterium sp. GA-1841]|nr:hypothetical protein A5740_03060 [Mycobacterium sp. GA-1841]